MKKITVALLISALIFCTACGNTNTDERTLALCVTADSGSRAAREASATVEGAVGYYLTEELEGSGSYGESLARVRARLGQISAIASAALRTHGAGYGATAEICESGSGAELTVRIGAGTGSASITKLYPYAEPKNGAQSEGYYKSLIKELFS